MKWINRILSYLAPGSFYYPEIYHELHIMRQEFDIVELYSRTSVHPNSNPSDDEISDRLVHQLINVLSNQIEITSDSICRERGDRVITGQLFLAKRRL